MEKRTMKLVELYTLDAELNGLVNPQTGEKVSSGLLSEKLPLTTKYWLTDLSKKISAEKALIDEMKNELIKKYGKEDENGTVSIPMIIEEETTDENGNTKTKKQVNPDYRAFEQEFNTFLDTEREIEYKGFKLTDFEKVETSETYTVFFSMLSVAEEEK